MKHLKLILIFFLFTPLGLQAQTIKVEGRVISAQDQEPLIGASVKVKDAPQGTITDFNGFYSIEVEANNILQFSYVGYQTTEEPVRNRTTINISLSEQDNIFDEIVVMGYSSQKRAELSSAVVTVKSDQLLDVATPDIGTMLQGKVAGLFATSPSGQPGTNAEIRIRGTGSIYAEASPLFVVDGIPGGTFNPNDVETVTILKDVGATAVYGADGAGGVIVITTKQASKNQATKFNFKANYGQKEALHGKFQMMNAKELYEAHRQIFSPALFALQRPPELEEMDFDWLNAAFRKGHLQNYYLSASGSSDKINYFVSTDYYQEDGTLMTTGYDKISSRLNLNAKLRNNLDMSIRLSHYLSNTDQESSYIVLEGAYRTIPWDDPYDEEGNFVFINGDVRPDNGKKWYTQDKRNFLHGEQYNYATSRSQGLTADLQLNWNILSWLSFSTTNRYSTSAYKYKKFIDPRTYDPSWSEGYVINNIGQYGSWSSSNLLKAVYEFGAHSINGLVGFEGGKSYSDYTSAEGIKMPNGIDGLGATEKQGVDGYYYLSSGYSWFLQAQYNYLSRYFLTASFRSDTSSKFSKNSPTGYFPAGSVAWLMSNEDFLSDNNIISFLKLRATYGVTGNSNIENFQSLAMYDLSTSYLNNVGAILVREANPNLTWESAHMAGLGLDISFLNRIHLNLDVYNLENRDLLLLVPYASSTGFESGLQNFGAVRNRGLEIQLSSDNVKTKDFLWNTTFNIGFNNNKVIKLPNDIPVEFAAGSSGVRQIATIGEDLTSWYMRKWMGVDPDTGDPLWEKLIKDEDGNIIDTDVTNDYNEADRQIVGKATPKFSGGLTNTISYKGISLYFNFNFVYGNSVYHRDRESYDSDGAYLGYNQMKLHNGWSRWEEEGDDATHPKYVMNGNKHSNSTSSRFLEDGSFLRLKNVTLSYNLPKKWLDTVKIQSCRLYLSTDNLFTLTQFSGLDPEVSLRRTSWSLPGVYSFNYPISRQFLIGVDINF